MDVGPVSSNASIALHPDLRMLSSAKWSGEWLCVDTGMVHDLPRETQDGPDPASN
jgi:hypothetical protein